MYDEYVYIVYMCVRAACFPPRDEQIPMRTGRMGIVRFRAYFTRMGAAVSPESRAVEGPFSVDAGGALCYNSLRNDKTGREGRGWGSEICTNTSKSV